MSGEPIKFELQAAYLRLQRAEDQFGVVRAEYPQYIAYLTAAVRQQRELEARTGMPAISGIEPPPPLWGVIIGEYIQGLRTALEYSAVELAAATASYTLKFKYAGNPDGAPLKKHLQITANAPNWGAAVSTSKVFDTTGHTLGAMGWKAGKLTFGGTAGDVVTITFQDTDSATAFGSTLDAVSLIGG